MSVLGAGPWAYPPNNPLGVGSYIITPAQPIIIAYPDSSTGVAGCDEQLRLYIDNLNAINIQNAENENIIRIYSAAAYDWQYSLNFYANNHTYANKPASASAYQIVVQTTPSNIIQCCNQSIVIGTLNDSTVDNISQTCNQSVVTTTTTSPGTTTTTAKPVVTIDASLFTKAVIGITCLLIAYIGYICISNSVASRKINDFASVIQQKVNAILASENESSVVRQP